MSSPSFESFAPPQQGQDVGVGCRMRVRGRCSGNGLRAGFLRVKAATWVDPPPLKWSALRYVLERMEKADGKKAVQAGGDCCKAPAG